ncbi:MAG TPA: nucleotide exchange factor GrpE [Candidatus Cloacimonetes bacterium]|nr:nucleotide exchange factor GrpE [Candidatus Cloacimonadota bacterium]HEX37832.1 nucleotide exchange factor GrpE [Candidatus Cloacimonadota bacterium]
MPKKKQEKETELDKDIEEINDHVEKLEEEIENLKEEVSSYKDRWLRSAAEFENFRRRNEKDRIDWIKNANKSLITDLINVYEHLEMAMESANTDQVPENFRKGIVMVHDELKSLLERYGLRRIEAIGQEFDPQYHEAIAHIEKEGFDDNIVCDCIQNGYILNDKVLRHARVAVAKVPEEASQNDGDNVEINSHKKKKNKKVDKTFKKKNEQGDKQ